MCYKENKPDAILLFKTTKTHTVIKIESFTRLLRKWITFLRSLNCTPLITPDTRG